MVGSCFKQKTTLVKSLIVLLILLIIVLIALFVNLVIRRDNGTCNSEHCIKTAAELIRYVDQTVRPCDDFHAFSCGKFMKNYKDPPPSEAEDELNTLIADFIRYNDSKAFIMQKYFYHSCKNLEAIEMDQEETVQDLFYQLGDWPVLRGIGWNGSRYDWIEFIQKSRKIGFKFEWLLEFSVYPDYNNTQTNLLKISVPKSLKPLKPADRADRKSLFTDVATFMGASKIAHYEVAKTIDFEDDLGIIAEIHRSRMLDRENVTYARMTISEMQESYKYIQWLELINNITGRRMSANDYVIFDALEYVVDLNKLIMGTPKRIVADYLMWRLVEDLWPYLTRTVRNLFENHYEFLNQTVELDRQKFCLKESRKLFPLVAESVYIREHVTAQKRQLVREMLFIIRKLYTQMIEDASWMNRQVQRKAIRKLQDIQFVVGGPQEVFDEFRFAENLGLYNFAFKSMNVIDMLTERRQRYYETYYSRLNRRIFNTTAEFYEKTLNISGFSIVHGNTMIIPAAVLRDTFYNPQMPNHLNYGSLGKALALEIFNHVFKDNNTFYDRFSDDYNNYNNNLDVTNTFEQSIQCLTNEMSYLTSPEVMRKEETFRDNLAHFVASDVAYESYKEWVRFLPQEYTLPGLKYTPLQLFWIQTSKFSCSKVYAKHDSDNSRFKIIGPLRNSRNFARDYKCPEGSKMNPRKKCRILY